MTAAGARPRTWLALGLCAVLLALASPAGAQTGSPPPAPSDTAAQDRQTGAPAAAGVAQPPAAGPDYDNWEALASRAELAASLDTTAVSALEQLRAEIVDWRQAFLAAQGTNAARIATLREQITALGPAPAESSAEAPEIAQRRSELADQLNDLQAPGINAGVAYSRADGLIREIDRVLRERQTSELLQVWPWPINPANWPAAFAAVTDNWAGIRSEVRRAAAAPDNLARLQQRLPAILALMTMGLALILRARVLMERLAARLPALAAPRWVRFWSLPISAAQVLLPVAGLLLILAALRNTAMLGPLGATAATSLVQVGLFGVTAHWLGRRIFPKDDAITAPLRLSQRQRREGRYLTTTMGLLVGLEALRDAMVEITRAGNAAASVLSFPVLVLAGLSLALMGWLLLRHVAHEAAKDSAKGLQLRLVGLLGRAAIAIGVLAPVGAAFGYVPAAVAFVYPAIVSLGIFALLCILQYLVDDLYDLVTGRSPDDAGALVPVLIGFCLSIAALPALALVWGARTEELAEIWTGFRQGFSIGETRIAPTNFLVFGVIFAIGYAATRILQGTLRSSVLPRTHLDVGGQNAVIAGVGYVGIFLSGLIAINSAGINLSGLAIVAGALSVGIGFGLQNIVQNFVSGIILLIERPISEGDWIEVAGVQGTVQAISVRSTRIQTFDRADVIVPNADLISGKVTNFTGFGLNGRLIVPVSVSSEADSRKVERILAEIAEAEPLVVMNPPPLIYFAGFTSDDMNFEIRVILRDVNFSLTVRTSINHEIIRRFREEGIDLPSGHRELWLREADASGAERPRALGQRQRPKAVAAEETATSAGPEAARRS